ncbi:ATP-binding protein [Lewinella sp. LCG006]|uniref:ATP-binding protein n=1 Tax=Lewinella sp. LCG006 TaxID=3231911 RepID=UPI003460DBAC
MSIPTEKVNYQGNPIVSVRIVSIHPSRLVVSLPDRRRGYIYKNDWSWDDSVRSEPLEFEKEKKIEAVLMRGQAGRESQRLSLRHLEDPWANAGPYERGQNVLAEIIYLRKNSIYVQLIPGVTAVIYSKDIPLLPHQLPGDKLAVGDKVRGTIIDYSRSKKRITLSLIQPLIQAEKDGPLNLKAEFEKELIHLISRSSFDHKKISSRVKYHYSKPLDRLQRILLVEDNVGDSRIVSELLTKELYAKVKVVTSSAAALKAIESGELYDLVLTDLNLHGVDNGIELATTLHHIYPNQAIALMSNNALAEFKIKDFERLYGKNLLFLEKPSTKDLAIRFIEGLRLLTNGKIKILKDSHESKDERLFSSLEQQLEQGGSRQERLKGILKDLCLISNLNRAILVKVDGLKKVVEVVSDYSTNGENLLPEHLDNLYFSAVRDIAEDRETLYISQKDDQKRLIRMHNFFPGIAFYSCYGISIPVPLSQNRYALIVLDNGSDISGMSISRIRTAGAYLSMTLEHGAMLEIVRKQQDLALQGTLMGTLLHELYNKLGPLFGFLEMGQKLQEGGKKEEFWEYVADVGPDLLRIKELTRAYTRLAKFELEFISLNTILEKVKQQLLPNAQEKGIQLVVETDPRQPKIWGIPIHLEQVLTNVVLNAIQWVDEQNYQWQTINASHGWTAAEALQNLRLVKIGVCEYPQKNICCILITDQGPGIPYHLRQRIFYPYISQHKDRQGLGLHISRDLTEAMHGKLAYVDSIRFLGSLFALFFPIVNESKDE